MILGMLRVKNEARWIERCICSILPVCDRVLLFDDHSDDGTPFKASGLPRVNVFDSPFNGTDEVRDKNFLLERAEQYHPEWIVHIDGDEEVQFGGCDIISAVVARNASPDCYRFQILYLWNEPDQIRTDGIYANFRRTRLFRFQPGARFRVNGNAANFHCGQVPQPREVAECDAKILHYGYMDRQDRVRKYEWYNKIDPNNWAEDAYRHMVIGDLVPSDSKFKYGGPLKLAPLPIPVAVS